MLESNCFIVPPLQLRHQLAFIPPCLQLLLETLSQTLSHLRQRRRQISPLPRRQRRYVTCYPGIRIISNATQQTSTETTTLTTATSTVTCLNTAYTASAPVGTILKRGGQASKPTCIPTTWASAAVSTACSCLSIPTPSTTTTITKTLVPGTITVTTTNTLTPTATA